MTSILDRIAQSSARTPQGHFQPKTPQEYFALRLAMKLDDAAAVLHYVELTDGYSEGQLLTAFERAHRKAIGTASVRFHIALQNVHRENRTHPPQHPLVAIRIERRTVAIAILNGDRLEFTDVRHLSSSPEKALGSAASFIVRTVEQFSVQLAALENMPNAKEVQRSRLQEVIRKVLSERAIGMTLVRKAEVLQSFSRQKLRSRAQIRAVISAIWPSLDQEHGGPFIHDAAALGLYVQTENLFHS